MLQCAASFTNTIKLFFSKKIYSVTNSSHPQLTPLSYPLVVEVTADMAQSAKTANTQGSSLA